MGSNHAAYRTERFVDFLSHHGYQIGVKAMVTGEGEDTISIDEYFVLLDGRLVAVVTERQATVSEDVGGRLVAAADVYGMCVSRASLAQQLPEGIDNITGCAGRRQVVSLAMVMWPMAAFFAVPLLWLSDLRWTAAVLAIVSVVAVHALDLWLRHRRHRH